MKMNYAEGDAGGKTEFFPDVSRFCPDLSGILSRSVLVFVPMWPDPKGGTGRTGSQMSGENRVKSDENSGAVALVVPQMQCTYRRPRARARWGQT